MASRKAINKSVNDEVQFIAAANVDKLFQWAEVDITHPDRDNDPNIKLIHRIYSPMFVKGKPYVAKLTVKEIITSKRNVIYTVEALEIEKPTMESYDAYAKMNLDPTSYPIVGSIDSLNEKLKNVNASKIIDENGEPRPNTIRRKWSIVQLSLTKSFSSAILIAE